MGLIKVVKKCRVEPYGGGGNSYNKMGLGIGDSQG